MNNKWEFRNKYTYWTEFGYENHNWEAVGRHLALVFHCSGRRKEDAPTNWSGGVESQYRVPPDYMEHKPPSHTNCVVLGGSCWHDGTSLWAAEFWIPSWQSDPHNHEVIFRSLNYHAGQKTDEHVNKEDDDDPAT